MEKNTENQNTPKYVTKKRVNVRCNRPFRLGMTPFSGYCSNIILPVSDIVKIIESKSMVEEILNTGETVALNFSNYNTYNGPTDVTDDSEVLTDVSTYRAQVINKFDANGHRIYEPPKRRFGGGFRKDPRTTGQIPGFYPTAVVEPAVDDIVIKEETMTDLGEKISVGNYTYGDVIRNLPNDNIVLIENNEKNDNVIMENSTTSSIAANVKTNSDSKSDIKIETFHITDTKESVSQTITTESAVSKENTSSLASNAEKNTVASILSLSTTIEDNKSSVDAKTDDFGKKSIYSTNGQSYNKKKK